MWPHKLASLLGFSSLPAVLLANCRFDIYAVGSDPIKQETCYDPNTPMASYEMALNTCTFVEKLPSNYRYKVIAAPDIKAAAWGAAECFIKDPSSIITLELDYCQIGTTFLYALCWNETFDPTTTVMTTFQNTAQATSVSVDQESSSQSLDLSTTGISSSSDDITTTSRDETSTQDPSSSSVRPTSVLESSTSTLAGSTSPTPTAMKSLSIEIQPTGTASAKNGEIAEGLQKEGNRIALGVGLGVGIPALIVAVIALYLQIMKRRTRP